MIRFVKKENSAGQLGIVVVCEICYRMLNNKIQVIWRLSAKSLKENLSVGELTALNKPLLPDISGRTVSEVEERLLNPNENPLFPKLIYAKHKINELLEDEANRFDAHLSFIIDYFGTTVATRTHDSEIGSSSLHNLLSEYITDYASGHRGEFLSYFNYAAIVTTSSQPVTSHDRKMLISGPPGLRPGFIIK